MKILKDEIVEFIPEGDVNLVILGTMASFVARAVNERFPRDAFYYHDGRNRFWGVISLILTGERIHFSSIENKKRFLNHYGIAMANLVQSVEVGDEINSSEDKILFDAYRKQKIQFKIISSSFKKILQEKPICFTCRRKMEIEIFIKEYFNKNSVSTRSVEDIEFLTSPTRKSYNAISESWRGELLSPELKLVFSKITPFVCK